MGGAGAGLLLLLPLLLRAPAPLHGTNGTPSFLPSFSLASFLLATRSTSACERVCPGHGFLFVGVVGCGIQLLGARFFGGNYVLDCGGVDVLDCGGVDDFG
jgi:hypothetical protein